MRKLLAVLLVVFVLSGCSQSGESNLGSAERNPMSDREREEFLDNLQREMYGDTPIYDSDGIIVNADRYIEVSSWKMNVLSQAYIEQNDTDYIKDSHIMLDAPEEYWMAHVVTTEDFECSIVLYGDEDVMTLEILLSDPELPYLIVPRGSIINGVLKNNTLFKGSESEKGRFLITADMSDFNMLEMFELTHQNIASVAWMLAAINTETREVRDFLVASQFPVEDVWSGLRVSHDFAAGSGIVMWVLREGDRSYLCTFNGTETHINSDITVTGSGSLVHSDFTLDVMSGECTYLFIGYDTSDIEVHMGETELLSEVQN